MVGGQSIVYVFAEMFGSEMRGVPFVYVVYGLVEEVFVPIHFHGRRSHVAALDRESEELAMHGETTRSPPTSS